MDIIQTFNGFCPTLNKDYSIEVEYEDVGTPDSPSRYIQGLVTCIHHGCPNVSACSIKAQLPKAIEL